MELIKSKDNPKIKLYQKLLNSKKYRKQNEMFVLEGIRLCEDALKENAELHCVFITQTALVKYGEALNLLKSENTYPTYIITDEIGDKISDTASSQGVFAIVKKSITYSFNDIRPNGKYLILDELQDPGNIGTIIRTADAVGLDAIILANCCDVYNPKVIRSTMGSVFRIPVIETDSISDVVSFLKENGTKVYASVVSGEAKSLTECDFKNSSAVVIGNEGNGLSDETAEMCDEKLTIKMSGNIESLNAAMASVIIMWEMERGISGRT